MRVVIPAPRIQQLIEPYLQQKGRNNSSQGVFGREEIQRRVVKENWNLERVFSTTAII